MILQPAEDALLKEAPQIYLKKSESKINIELQVNRTKSARNRPWNPKSALEPTRDAFLYEAPQIYCKKPKIKLNFEFQEIILNWPYNQLEMPF